MIRAAVQVVNRKGIHAKCASQLVELAKRFRSELTVHRGTTSASLKSILGLMLLEAECGAELEVVAQGPDQEEALGAVLQLFASGFGEPAGEAGADPGQAGGGPAPGAGG